MATDLEGLKAQLQSLAELATNSVGAVQTPEELEQLRVEYLGKKGSLSQILGLMGKLAAEERPQVGAIANQVKQALQTQLEERKISIQQSVIAKRLELERLDVTMPGILRSHQGRQHPIQSTIDRMLVILVGMGFTVAQDPKLRLIIIILRL